MTKFIIEFVFFLLIGIFMARLNTAYHPDLILKGYVEIKNESGLVVERVEFSPDGTKAYSNLNPDTNIILKEENGIDSEDFIAAFEEGDIECKCQNLTSTVEKDIKCTCENLTAEVKKDCSIKADGNANIKAPNIKLEGEVSIQGNVTISGNTDVSGTVTASEVIGGGKSLSSHIHQGVHGPTGGPQ